ncbi:RagB/SusD family nutrient uptake outer membrane protein [Pedobacter frigoris]|nr:RagB/SusD family nutrient uptake outer membrane protein [Pedobacter frigoris]
MKKFNTYILIILTISALSGCKKQNDWLNEKTNKSDIVPQKIGDYQAILDNTLEMNERAFINSGLVASDNMFIRDKDVAVLWEYERNIYLWQGNYWEGGNSSEWNYGFRGVEFSNLVLEGLAAINNVTAEHNNVMGQAYFYRAFALYNLAQLFCKPYTETSAGSDLGLPIRETSDVNVIIRERSSLKQTYDFILADLQHAIELLPQTQPYNTRPNVRAAKALLSKVYLVMEDYAKAGIYADQVLTAYGQLLDFNNTSIINYNSDNRFPLYGTNNPEILFYAQKYNYTSITAATINTGVIVPELYTSYSSDDLRKTLLYTTRDGAVRYVGSYTGWYYNFVGIATNELYLIRAECSARNGSKDQALADLNLLLQKRFKTGTFTGITASSAEDALKLVLIERRKELPFTANLRWEDLRRLNRDQRFQKTITRTANGTVYTLLPNDKRYVFPIPDSEIEQSGIQQNER